MISAKKVDRLERFWEVVAGDVESQLRVDGHVLHYHALSRLEIRERVRSVIRSLESWLLDPDNEKLASQYRALGAQRAAQDIPLHEVIYKISIIKQKLERRVLESDPSFSAIEMYDEYEWMRTIERGFEVMIEAIASGYEAAVQAEA